MNLVRMLRGVKIPAAIIMALVLALALAGGVMAAKGAISSASIPPTGPFHACYVPHKNVGEKQGKLRIVSDGEKCKRSEVAIIIGGSGDGAGPEGPQGVAGPAGPTGPAGDAVPASVVELRSLVTGTTDGTTGSGSHLTAIMFDVALRSGEAPVDLTPGTAKIRLDYLSQSITSTTSSRFHTTPVSGADSDLILETGEILRISLLDFDAFLAPDLGEGTTFMIDVISEFGSVLTIDAKTPGQFSGASPVTLPLVP